PGILQATKLDDRAARRRTRSRLREVTGAERYEKFSSHSVFRFREFGRETNRGNHAIRTGNAFAGDVEGGAVIGTGARKRQAEGDVHAGMKGVQLQRNQALIVIQTESGVPFLVSEMEEESIRRDGPLENC